jgi:hypothetical protein
MCNKYRLSTGSLVMHELKAAQDSVFVQRESESPFTALSYLVLFTLLVEKGNLWLRNRIFGKQTVLAV